MPAGRRRQRGRKASKMREATLPLTTQRSSLLRRSDAILALSGRAWLADPPSPLRPVAGASLELGPPTNFLNPKKTS